MRVAARKVASIEIGWLRSWFLAFLVACGVAGEWSMLSAHASGLYEAMTDAGVSIPAVPLQRIPRRFLRQVVAFGGDYAPGTIVVDPKEHFLYFVQTGGRALRYGVGVGRGAFAWSGSATVARKANWPRWRPTADMLDRAPNLAMYGEGLRGNLFNPLGARAFYLFQGSRDTLYRIHGTSEWWSIGNDASSGCIRMLNQDIIDLNGKIRIGANVVVLPRSVALIRRR